MNSITRGASAANDDGRYPRWLRRALYRRAIEVNIVPPQGVYRRPAIRPAPFYTPYGVQFVWDLPYSGYAVARVGGDVLLAKGFVENMLEFAIEDGPDTGALPRSVTFAGDQAGQDGTQTPLLAWLTLRLHELEPDEAFLARTYATLAASIDWWQSPRRDFDGDGLSEYAGSTPTHVAYESGHDYSPERDLVMGEPTEPSSDGLVHEPIADVFLNACLYAELDALATIAEAVEPDRTSEWQERRDALAGRMTEAMWDREVGGFFPVVRADLCRSQPRVYRHTPALLQPLWAGVATPEEGERTIATLLGRPRDYPWFDGTMTIHLDPDLYHGYQIVSDGLHPTRGSGAAAGGVELADDGFVARFGQDRGPAAAAFTRLEIQAEIAGAGSDAAVEVSVVDGRGQRHIPLQANPREGQTLQGLVGRDPMLALDTPSWTPGLREMRLVTTGCRVMAVRLRYARMDRAGLLSPFGIKSAHPLDGKHPAPGAPTEFWSGTVWGPHSFHGCIALSRYGHHALALATARAYCDAVATAFAAGGESFEHHSHEDGRGLGITDYTWGGGVALVLMADLLDREDRA
ncbi:MAG: hypothetical protein KY437_00630 [Actinobacteria bacterium]|nr:hypothetical protein [Actinomycetota bacterium]